MHDPDQLGSQILERYHRALTDQARTVMARRIRTRVRAARANRDAAAPRWPFELIQNAHDARAREGRKGITITFEHSGRELVFSHDAAPFSLDDIAALLSGGSSKDFESEETTGRFGTGFLVTHVLTQRVQVSGVLQHGGAHRSFSVELYRPDNELEILDNIRTSESALTHTQAISDFDHRPTTTVRYVVDEPATVHVGLETLEASLPYLFASCPRLTAIHIVRDGRDTCWAVINASSRSTQQEGLAVTDLEVRSHQADNLHTSWRAIRVGKDESARGHLVVALRQEGEAWTVWQPPPSIPRIFRQLPVFGAPHLSTWAIVDGAFELDQERSSIYVTEHYGAPLRHAFEALGGLALFAARQEWTYAHRLAHVTAATGIQGPDATAVWREVLSQAAARVAALPLVATARGLLPASTEGVGTVAEFLSSEALAFVQHDELWWLADRCTMSAPPVKPLSKEWTEIAEGWKDLGIHVRWLDLPRIADRARNGATMVEALGVTGDAYEFLARYVGAVGAHWAAAGIKREFVTGMIPDQHHRLRGANELRRDGGISERLKAIAHRVGYDVRALLLDERLLQMIDERALSAGLDAIRSATDKEMSEREATDELIRRISAACPPERSIPEASRPFVDASIELLEHLWESLGPAGRDVATTVPLLTHDGSACLATEQRMLLLPIDTWPEAARRFARAFPHSRVLSGLYASPDRNPSLLKAFVAWRTAHPALVGKAKRKELRDRALRAIALNPDDVDGAKASDCELMQIAMLEPEVINHCKQSQDLARALLGLVVCHVAGADDSWRTTVTLEVSTRSGKKNVEVTPSLWVSDLRSKPWIRMETEGDVTEHVPSPELIRTLLDPDWLDGNEPGAQLLVDHFEMDALDVRLLVAARDDDTRQRIRDGLAKIVEAAGADPQALAEIAERAARRKYDVGRMRELGLAVQKRVEQSLRALGLDVKVIDRGFDFLVGLSEVSVRDNGEDLSAYFEVGRFKMEVKATTVDEVRLTALQAATAASDAAVFVLCVVDLRDMGADAAAVTDWSTVDVGSRSRIVPGRALPTGETLALIDAAEGTPIPIRNATALRYAVGADRWDIALLLADWVALAFGSAATGTQ